MENTSVFIHYGTFKEKIPTAVQREAITILKTWLTANTGYSLFKTLTFL